MAGMRTAVVATLLLLAACTLAEPLAGRGLLQGGKVKPWVDPSQLQECGDMARDTLTPPPGATKAVVFDARGSENYTCITDRRGNDRWTVLGSRKDLYDQKTGQFSGYIYTEASDIENTRLVFTDPTNTTEIGDAVKDNQVTLDVDSPNPTVNRKMWRRPLVRATGVAENVQLVIKTDVKGGMPPDGKECDTAVDTEMLVVPMSNVYTMYACKNKVRFPYRVPKCDLPGLPDFESDDLQVAWELQTNGTRNWTCADGAPQFDGAKCSFGDGGSCYYTQPTPEMDAGRVGHFVIETGKGATYWLNTLANVTAPAPGGDALDWAAWPIDYIRGEPQCDYIVRSDTSGGVPPTSCGSTPDGGEITVEYTATYTCLQCK